MKKNTDIYFSAGHPVVAVIRKFVENFFEKLYC